jgi:tripartite-type tricarboxylate transporter receptor subunit TctC
VAFIRKPIDKARALIRRAVAKMKVGPVLARFKGKVTLSDLDPQMATSEQDQTPQALAQLVKSEIDKWVPIIKSAGVDVQ